MNTSHFTPLYRFHSITNDIKNILMNNTNSHCAKHIFLDEKKNNFLFIKFKPIEFIMTEGKNNNFLYFREIYS